MRTGAAMDHVAFNWTGHGVSLVSILLTVAGVLPALAALFAVIWYMVQIYESYTFQRWAEKRRALKKAKRIARLRAEQKVLLAELEAMEVVREARAVADDKVATAAADAKTLLANADTHDKVQKAS